VIEYQIGSRIPDSTSWLECISGPSVGWLRALLTTPVVVQGKSFIDNPLKRLFAPRRGQKVVVDHSKATISLYGAGRSFGPHPAGFNAVQAKFDSSGHIKITVNEERKGALIPLTLIYTYRPDQGYAPIHEVMEDRTTRIKDFYWRLWFGEDEEMPSLDSKQVFEGPEVTIDAMEIERFCAVVRNDGEAFKGARTENVRAPLDFAIVTGWQVRNIFSSSSRIETHSPSRLSSKPSSPSLLTVISCASSTSQTSSRPSPVLVRSKQVMFASLRPASRPFSTPMPARLSRLQVS